MTQSILLILVLCWPFGARRHAAPQRPAIQRELDPSGQPVRRWYEKTPHWEDGYWTKQPWTFDYKKYGTYPEGEDEYWDEVWRKRLEGYPFDLYVWDWPGRKPTDKTWRIESFKDGKPPEKPKPYELQESYSPYWPAQRGNL